MGGGGGGGATSLCKEVPGSLAALFGQDTMNKIVDRFWCENRTGNWYQNFYEASGLSPSSILYDPRQQKARFKTWCEPDL